MGIRKCLAPKNPFVQVSEWQLKGLMLMLMFQGECNGWILQTVQILKEANGHFSSRWKSIVNCYYFSCNHAPAAVQHPRLGGQDSCAKTPAC